MVPLVLLILGLVGWSKLQDRRHGREEERHWEPEPSLDEILGERDS